jgi:predicted dehydrogenase
MTTTTAEATELIDEAADRGIKLIASPGQMIGAMNWAIRDLLNSGAIGRLAWAAVGASFGTYHEGEKVRQGDDVLSNINPAWYWRKPGGGPMYDMTVYGLHNLTGVMGAARRVTGMSGVGIPERTFRGEKYACDADDNTMLLLDFGDTVFAFVYGTLAGSLTQFAQVNYFGTNGSIVGREINGKPIDLQEYSDRKSLRVEVDPEHGKLGESHVFQDIMQLARWVSEGIPSVATAEHARHVIEIIEAGYRASETGQTQELTTDFEFPTET